MADKQSLGAEIVNVIVSRARVDSPFRQQLLSDGNDMLTALGLQVPAGVTVKFVEDTDSVWHFVIPAAAAELDVSDGDLDRVAGGRAPAQLARPRG